MSRQLFPSNAVKMYPSARRSDYYDRNAKLNSEQNLITTVNRLTGQDSFIISGLTINAEGTRLEAGQCNIHGYLFRLLESQTLTSIQHSDDKPYLALSIQVAGVTSTLGGVSDTYYTLCSVDATEDSPLIQANVTTSSGSLDNGDEYYGIALVEISKSTLYNLSSEDANSKIVTYYLPVAEWDETNSKWISIKAVDGQTYDENDTSQTYSVYKLRTTDIQINTATENGLISETSDSDIAVTNKYYNNPQSLDVWLRNNIIIDDGVIE